MSNKKLYVHIALSLLLGIISQCHLEAQTPKSPSGMWLGTLDAGQVKLRIVFHVSEAGSGNFTATMDSPDQGVKGIATSAVRVTRDSVVIEVASIRGAFEGKLQKDGNSIAGKWKQAGREFPLLLTRSETTPELHRPQTPKKPYPYLEEEVAYRNTAAGITLAGTLTKPSASGPFPAVLLITGSGPQDRNETIAGHSPFLVLADYLTRRGIAVLRVDDRGVGSSTGSLKLSTTEDFVSDVLAGVAYLKQRSDIQSGKIGLVGHSEGGIIAPMAASRSNDIAFIVMMAGTGLRGDALLLMQNEAIMRKSGAPDSSIQKVTEINSLVYSTVLAETDTSRLRTALAEQLAERWGDWGTVYEAQGIKQADAITTLVERVTLPWFRYFISLDPRKALAQVRCPVLAVNGEMDVQVPAKKNLFEIERTLRAGGNNNVTIKELTGLNHLFQTAKTGLPQEYGTIEETISPTALALIGDWIETQIRH